jgi:lytic cellulose monooxygenase (C4-dehydrogenating)
VTMVWHRTLDGDKPGDKSDPIDPGHLGPTIAYMARVNDATTERVTGLRWFKVHQDGMDANKQWGVTRMYKNRGKVSFKVPSCIPSGQYVEEHWSGLQILIVPRYLLRGEVIALHGAGNPKGAQFYMECAQLNVAGGGNANPPTVAFPGAYKQNDPGVLFQVRV